jgi:hypothetical protein
LTFGIVAVVTSWTIIGGAIFGLTAIGVGIVAYRGDRPNRGKAIAGIALGALSILIGICMLTPMLRA